MARKCFFYDKTIEQKKGDCPQRQPPDMDHLTANRLVIDQFVLVAPAVQLSDFFSDFL